MDILKLLQSGLLGTKSNVYKTKFYLYQYNDKNFRLVKLKSVKEKGWEEEKKKKTYIDYNEKNEEIERVSISRTRRNIRELALCNEFEYFATLTVASEHADRFSLTEVQTLLRKKLKALKRKNENFAYLFITEKHKNRSFPLSSV